MLIHPEVAVTPDFPTIKFRQPREQVNLSVELPRILHAQGWGCGTYFHVQFVDKDRTKLLASALFVVTEEIESLQTSEANPYQPVTKTVFNRKCEQVGDWWPGLKPLERKDVKVEPVKKPGEITYLPYKVSWNPGKKMHQVKDGEHVIYETTNKAEAHDIADGKIPVPRAA